jgi:hypothetical protein
MKTKFQIIININIITFLLKRKIMVPDGETLCYAANEKSIKTFFEILIYLSSNDLQVT